MISVIEGPDFGRARLLIKSLTKDWPNIKMIRARKKDFSELDAALFNEDCIIVKRAERLGERYAEYIKTWRYKNLIFMTDTALKRGVFSRKSKRLGKSHKMALGKVAKEKIQILADQLAIPPEMKMALKTRCFSVSEALNAAECYALTGEIPMFRSPPLILFLSEMYFPLFDIPLQMLARHLSSLSSAVGSGDKGWVLLKKISKASPGAVGVIFNVFQKLKDDSKLRLFLLKIGLLLSEKAEEVGSLRIPMSYFLLLTKEFDRPQLKSEGERKAGFSFRSHAGTRSAKGWRGNKRGQRQSFR